MGVSKAAFLLGLALALAPMGAATAQWAAPARGGASPPPASAATGMDVLKGAWVRPDGGYVIAIRSVAADGQIDATYHNPSQLPFAKARASRDGATLRAFFELQAGGYAGSTYDLVYDPASDRLKGVYSQAVARQKYDIYFVRK